MRHSKWITCGWPGLARLWLDGQWTGLAVATGFGVIFNTAIILQLKMAGHVSENVQLAGWLITFVFWLGGCLDGVMVTLQYSRQQQLGRRRHSEAVNTATSTASESTDWVDVEEGTSVNHSSVSEEETGIEPSQTSTDDLFIQARNQYLKGNWLQCESLLDSALEDYPGDLESRLLRISLLRATRRFEEALLEITRFNKWDGAEKWSFEVSREVELLERILSEKDESPETQAA